MCKKVKIQNNGDWICPKCEAQNSEHKDNVKKIDKVLCNSCYDEFELDKNKTEYEDSEIERLLNLLKYSQEAIDYWFNGCGDSPEECINENDHFKEEVKYFIEKLSI